MKNYTEVKVYNTKYCDLCQVIGKTTVALYDAKTKMGPWGYLCKTHFQEQGIGLGLGKGQKLIYVDEKIRR